jgi:hypothetical protein
MLKKGKLTAELIAETKAAYTCPIFKWTSDDKKDEAIIKQIDLDLLARVRMLAAESEAQGKALPVKEVNDLIFTQCVIWPALTEAEKEELIVGAIPSIVKDIQEKSGLLEVDIFGRPLGPDLHVSILKDFNYWGDLTEAEGAALKEASPFQLFRVRVGRWVFALRPMTRLDLKLASQAEDDTLSLVKTVTMWPTEVDWNTIPTGVVIQLAETANRISGWSSESSVEEL